MRRLVLLVAALAATAVASPAIGSAATVEVRITKDGFSPASVTVDVDDTVRWTNRDTVAHQIVADDGSFASPVLQPGRSYSFTFRFGGTYRYRDALEPKERGTVTVRGRPASVTLAATPPILRSGDTAHLTGVVSNRRAGESVTILQQPFGQASYTELTVAVTTTGGAFDVVVEPELLTSYQARFRSASSQAVTIQVRPRITLTPRGRGFFLTRVTAARSYAGRWVYLQRRTPFGQWVSTRKLTLGPQSGRIFRVRPRVRTTYRIFMTINQAGSGYLESWSGSQLVRAPR